MDRADATATPRIAEVQQGGTLASEQHIEGSASVSLLSSGFRDRRVVQGHSAAAAPRRFYGVSGANQLARAQLECGRALQPCPAQERPSRQISGHGPQRQGRSRCRLAGSGRARPGSEGKARTGSTSTAVSNLVTAGDEQQNVCRRPSQFSHQAEPTQTPTRICQKLYDATGFPIEGNACKVCAAPEPEPEPEPCCGTNESHAQVRRRAADLGCGFIICFDAV